MMFFCGILSFLLKQKHFLLMLLSLEFIVISLFLNIFMYLNMSGNEYFFILIYLIMSVCEGVLGLSILVSMIRVCGNDYILSFSSLW
uniref:NADH-ubiquinone oxidoreductase chain 4L n=1 Tax=Glena unipennaria TaxID=1981046 RepID=A0A343YVI7_9NEOP|nr:NADH dehydrogenase subunit 4L [Glena unipennaria]